MQAHQHTQGSDILVSERYLDVYNNKKKAVTYID